MLSKTEMLALERFINFLNEDETQEIKYSVIPVVRGKKFWAVKVFVSSIACETKETTIKVCDMIHNFENIQSRIFNMANILERNIFMIS